MSVSRQERDWQTTHPDRLRVQRLCQQHVLVQAQPCRQAGRCSASRTVSFHMSQKNPCVRLPDAGACTSGQSPPLRLHKQPIFVQQTVQNAASRLLRHTDRPSGAHTHTHTGGLPTVGAPVGPLPTPVPRPLVQRPCTGLPEVGVAHVCALHIAASRQPDEPARFHPGWPLTRKACTCLLV